jgi:deoxyribonuclease-4
MLIGAHVSSSGGPAKAWERAVELGCDAMQIFNQSPRMWRPTAYSGEELAELSERLDQGPVRSMLIHAVYLINPASNEPEVRDKSLASLVHALRTGDAVGADGVVLHPGSQKGEPLEPSLDRVGEALRHALGESQHCPLLLENTAGAGGTLGRSFAELASLLERGGGHERLGICLDSCHLLASGFDVRTANGLSGVMDAYREELDLERLRCLHVNDSQVGLGANRDRHAPLPEGELGREGLAAFLSEPRFEGLPALLEGPSPGGGAVDAGQMALARKLREKGLAARATPPRV